MLASRIDQENRLHDRGAATGSKPLNAAKTPGHKAAPPKTPFRVPLNDENAITRGAGAGPAGGKNSAMKTGAKGENVMTVGKKMLNSAFITPAGMLLVSLRDEANSVRAEKQNCTGKQNYKCQSKRAVRCKPGEDSSKVWKSTIKTTEDQGVANGAGSTASR
jgi:hypothetical protein